MMLRDGWLDQIKWIFGKVPKGGGVIFNTKNYVLDFGNFKQSFLSMKAVWNISKKSSDLVAGPFT